MQQHPFPKNGFLRLAQIVGDSKANPPLPAIIPVSKSTWWAGVKSGRFPAPMKLSERCTAWSVESILALIEQIATQNMTDSQEGEAHEHKHG